MYTSAFKIARGFLFFSTRVRGICNGLVHFKTRPSDLTRKNDVFWKKISRTSAHVHRVRDIKDVCVENCPKEKWFFSPSPCNLERTRAFVDGSVLFHPQERV